MASLPSSPKLEVSLRNKGVFDQFSGMVLEQVICKKSRIFFPMPHFTFSGLESGVMYKMGMRFDRISDKKYLYSKDLWQTTKNPAKLSASSDIHWTGALDEKYWTKFGERMKVYVSNQCHEENKEIIQLESMALYEAVLLVQKIGDGEPQEFKFSQLEFMTVARYKNQKVMELKSALNPFSCREAKIGKAKKRHALADVQNGKRQRGDSDSDDDDDNSQLSNSISSTSGNSSLPSFTASPIPQMNYQSTVPHALFNNHMAPVAPLTSFFNYPLMAPGIQNIPPTPSWGSFLNPQPMTRPLVPYGFTNYPNPILAPHPFVYPPAPMAPRYPDPVFSPTDSDMS